MILVIDNYDSFTYNLVQYLGELGAELHVVRNDAVDVDGVIAHDFQRGPELAEVLDEVVGEGVVIVDDDDHRLTGAGTRRPCEGPG